MKDGQTEVGDVIRDPITGVLYDVVGVLRPSDLGQFNTGHYRGCAAERCALFGIGTNEERASHKRRMRLVRQPVQARKGAA